MAAQDAARIRGRVVDDSTGGAIAAVELVLFVGGRATTDRATYSDDDGRFTLRRPRSAGYAVYARRIGYSPAMTPVEDAGAEVEIRLARRAENLPTVTTTGRERPATLVLEKFEERRLAGVGVFFTRDDLEQRGWPNLPNLLRGVPGVQVLGGGNRAGVAMSRSAQARRCQPVLFLDGVRLNKSTDSPATLRGLLDMIPGADLTAVEVYKGRSEIPAEFGGPEVGCGAIVVWTKEPVDELRRLRRR